jgi:hypothetical protein
MDGLAQAAGYVASVSRPFGYVQRLSPVASCGVRLFGSARDGTPTEHTSFRHSSRLSPSPCRRPMSRAARAAMSVAAANASEVLASFLRIRTMQDRAWPVFSQEPVNALPEWGLVPRVTRRAYVPVPNWTTGWPAANLFPQNEHKQVETN